MTMTESRPISGGAVDRAAGDGPTERGASALAPTSTPKRTLTPTKRTLTRENLLRTTVNMLVSCPAVVRSIFKPRTSKALREKVMLGVTSVNDCRYCSWAHTHWAMDEDIPLEEINEILAQQNEAMVARDEAEAAAILFGQDYAENGDQFELEAMVHLREYYSKDQVAEIIAFVRFVTFWNLTGNTLDARLGRVHVRMPCRFHNSLSSMKPGAALGATQRLVKDDGGAPVAPREEIAQALRDGAAVLDVRTQPETKRGVAPGATNISVFMLEHHLDELPRDRTIVTYCASGHRAGVAKRILEDAGFTAINGGGYGDFMKIAQKL